MVKIHPTAHRVLVKLKKFEELSKGGIVLTTSEAQNIREQRAMEDAIVVELGPTAFKDFSTKVPWCKVGDLVIIGKYSGIDRMDKDTKEIYRLINDEDIIAVIEGE